MTGPKHLWSGAWQSESMRPAAAPPRAAEQEPEAALQPSLGVSRRDLGIALSAALATAAITLAAVTTLGGSSDGKNSGQNGRGNRTAANSAYPTADWLGMQIGTASPSGVYINAMNTSGAAIVSGLEPGDQILSINNHRIDTVPEIRTDTNSLKLGASVEITVLRNSVEVRSQLIPMMQRPTIHP